MWKQAQPSAEMHALHCYSAQDGLDIKHSYSAWSDHLQQHHHLIAGTFRTFQLHYRITESQNHRITESQNGRGWKGPNARCTGPCPGGS